MEWWKSTIKKKKTNNLETNLESRVNIKVCVDSAARARPCLLLRNRG